MQHKLVIYTILALVLLGLAANSTQARNLMGKTRIELAGGFWGDRNNTEAEYFVGYHDPHVGSDGSIGSLTLSHWNSPHSAFTISYSILDYEESDRFFYPSDFHYRQSIVQSVTLGMRFYAPTRYYSTWHPFLSAEVGPYIGYSRTEEFGPYPYDLLVRTHTETQPGLRLGGGVDIELGRHFLVGMNGGYNFVREFDRPINGRTDYSGADFRFSLSFVFGGRR